MIDETFTVIGVATRTTNAAESDPSTARLPELWERAMSHPRLAELRERVDAHPVAVLTDYADDETGAYTQVVGVRASIDELVEGLVAVVVPAEGRRRVEARGPMPDSLVEAWQRIWADTSSGALRRGFRTDYEVHSERGAEIHLSLEDPSGSATARG